MKVVGRTLVGSQNYQLDGPDSDHDYKLLMMPEFNDFYTYHRVSKDDLPKKYDPEHYNVISVLKFDENLRKGNVNALEMLFSREQELSDELASYFGMAKFVYSEGYLFTVWDTFLATVEGMMKNSLDRYGVNRKSASRALYLVNFCSFVAKDDFTVDEYTWGEYEVFAAARELRYNEEKRLPTREELFTMFEDMKRKAEVYHKRHRLTDTYVAANWNDFLALCMREVVKTSLRREL